MGLFSNRATARRAALFLRLSTCHRFRVSEGPSVNTPVIRCNGAHMPRACHAKENLTGQRSEAAIMPTTRARQLLAQCHHFTGDVMHRGMPLHPAINTNTERYPSSLRGLQWNARLRVG